MKITSDILLKYGASAEDIQFVHKFYPEGIELNDVFNTTVTNFSLELIHWMYLHLPISEAEKKEYLNYIEVEGSKYFFYSYHIKDCNMIADSIFCENSIFIFDSSYIKNSKIIYNSEDVLESYQIFSSQLVTNSQHILKSYTIENSFDILDSKDIKNSTNIAYSKRINDSSILVKCSDVSNSYFSRNLVNCKNKLFCFDLKNTEDFMIFNEFVSEDKFHTILKIMQPIWNKKIFFVPIVEDNNLDLAISWQKILNTIEKIISKQEKQIDLLLLKNILDNDNLILSKIKRNLPNINLDKLYELTLASNIYS